MVRASRIGKSAAIRRLATRRYTRLGQADRAALWLSRAARPRRRLPDVATLSGERRVAPWCRVFLRPRNGCRNLCGVARSTESAPGHRLRRSTNLRGRRVQELRNRLGAACGGSAADAVLVDRSGDFDACARFAGVDRGDDALCKLEGWSKPPAQGSVAACTGPWMAPSRKSHCRSRVTQLFSSKRQSNRWFALTCTRASVDSGIQRRSAIRETSEFANPVRREMGAMVDERVTTSHRVRAIASSSCLLRPFR